jgi:peptide/nickel transport system substrate-binding protein
MTCENRFVAGVILCAALLASPLAASPSDGVVRIGLPEQPNTLNPLVGAQFYENYLDCAIFSGLTVIDSHGDVAPDLAQRVPTARNGGISKDGLTMTYALRTGVRWQDGVPLTARDVVFTFERMRDPRTGFPSASQYDDVAAVEARDPRTVVVRLKKRDADAVAEIFVNGQNGSIVPEHVLRGVTDMRRAAFSSSPVGSGPYIVESWSRDSGIVLRANARYFRGKPAIDTLRIAFLPDNNTMALQLRAGDLDFAPGIAASAVPALRATPGLRVADVPSYTIVMLDNHTNAPPLDDVRVRHALALSADREAIARKAYLGIASPAAELVPPWSTYATFRTAKAADAAGASALLDAAGWRRGADGMRAKAGQRLALTLTTVAGARSLASAATLLQAQWRALGIEVELRPILSNQLYAPDGILASGNFQFTLHAFGFATTADRSTTLASHSIPPGGLNYARYRNATVDAAIDTAHTSSDPTVRRRAFAVIARAVARDVPYAPLVWSHQIEAISTRLLNVSPEPVNSDLWNIWAWRLR